MNPLKRNAQNVLWDSLDFTDILIQNMENKCGFPWDGIAPDVNTPGWIKKQTKKFLHLSFFFLNH